MKYAGFWIRGAAFLIDLVLINAVEFAFSYTISRILGLDPFSEQVFDTVLSLGFYFYYYCVLQVKRGATFGKQWLGLEIVRVDGSPFKKRHAALRAFGYLLSFLMLGCGFIMAAFHPEKRTFHDLISGTLVIRKSK